MPIYEYRCQSCGKLVEVIQKFSDKPLSTCESCSGPLEKLVSRTSFHLSGGGWGSSGYSKSDTSPSTSDSSPSKNDTSPSKSDTSPSKSDTAPSKSDGPAETTGTPETKKASSGS